MKNRFYLFLIFSLSVVVKAETFLQAPTPPVYENCSAPGVNYKGCRNRNEAAQEQYSQAMTTYNRAKRIITTDAGTTTEPVLNLQNCNTASDYSNCQHQNRSAQKDFNLQHDAWARAKNDEAKASQASQISEANKKIAEVNALSATEALQVAQQKNAQAKSKSIFAAIANAGKSAAFASAFSASCSTGCQGALLAASVAFSILSSKSSKQASQNAASGYNACMMEAKMSATTKSCGPQPPAITSIYPPKGFNQNGDCISTDPSVCQEVLASLPAGVKVKDLASNPLFTVNPDGSVTTKDGKTYQPDDFNSLESLKAVGLTDDEAREVLANLNKAGVPGSALADAKKDLKKSVDAYAIDSSSLNSAGISSNGKSGSKDSGSGVISTIGEKKRIPAGEGLTRDFNGEAIGVAGDDIFNMMNRRYKVKTAQDTFISH